MNVCHITSSCAIGHRPRCNFHVHVCVTLQLHVLIGNAELCSIMILALMPSVPDRCRAQGMQPASRLDRRRGKDRSHRIKQPHETSFYWTEQRMRTTAPMVLAANALNQGRGVMWLPFIVCTTSVSATRDRRKGRPPMIRRPPSMAQRKGASLR